MSSTQKPEISFPNGFESWAETHHDIVEAINRQLENEESIAFKVEAEKGIGGIYELGTELTHQFEASHNDSTWIDGDYFTELEKFLNGKI